MKPVWAVSVVVAALSSALAPAAPVDALANDAPWRVFLVCSEKGRGRNAPAVYTPAPPDNWTQADFDDGGWGRYGSDWQQAIGGYGFGQSPTDALLCLRTAFGIADPGQARDLTLALEYRGGIVVYVNGRELGRQHLPAGKLELGTPATDYPAAVVNTALPRDSRPATENLAQYEQRIRKFTVTVPASALRRGANTLAIELHPAQTAQLAIAGKGDWNTVGLCDVKLTSASGTGVTAYTDALKQLTLANATPMDTIAVRPRLARGMANGLAKPSMPLTRGNPFEPIRPMRTLAPRGGAASAQVVVTGPEPFSGLRATVSPLRHAGGNAAIPAELVRIRYGQQPDDDDACSALHAQPADGVAVQPVWVLVDVPRDQTAGWYTAELKIAAGGQTWTVPLHVLVAGWTVPVPERSATLLSIYQSPDTLAVHYKVDPWSDKHFALIEKSMNLMAKTGNDVLLVPVAIQNYLNHRHGLVRWVRKGPGYEPDYAAFERYLDQHIKAFGKPKVVTLSVWKHDFGTRSWFRGMKSEVIKPCMVTEVDPQTGQMKPMQAPHFGEPGSEEFWKTMIEGVRKIIRQRGVDDRFLLLGEAFDSRPLEKHLNFFKQIEPDMRWQIYSHFDGAEPPPKNGKFICHGGFELGFRIGPNDGGLPEFSRGGPKASVNEFLEAQAARTHIHATSSPLSFRAVLQGNGRGGGTLARIGLDFWAMPGADGRRRSFYACPPNEGWLWRGHVPSLTVPGPDGAALTTRAQMLIEAVQEAEATIALLRARPSASPQLAARIDACRADRHAACRVGESLPQATISLDWYTIADREYAVAAELAGVKYNSEWRSPPK